MNSDNVSAESLATPGCPGCARLIVEVRELRKRVMKLQAQLNQNSTNSSKPPSSDPPATPPPQTKEKSGRKPGGQPGHQGHCRDRLPRERVTRIVRHVPEQCEACGKKFPRKAEPSDPADHEPSWHQVTEAPPFAAEVTEHQGHACACENRGHITRADIPPEIRAHVIGPNLASILSFLSGRCHESKRTVQEVAESLFEGCEEAFRNLARLQSGKIRPQRAEEPHDTGPRATEARADART